MTIAENRIDILNRLKAAAPMTPPTLVAVSKVQPDERIREMLATGQTVYGENRVQEAQGRWEGRFADQRKNLSLHLIGPLQSNKSEDAVALFDVIETLDREKLAKTLASAAQKLGRCPNLYVQVNTGQEPQKAGVSPQQLDVFLKTARETYDLTIKGLMCIPPVEEAASAHFILLSKLAKRNGLTALSMGMSADYEIAAKLGATHVRIGSALFGAREDKA